MRVNFSRIDRPAEALFVPGADVISLPLAVSLLENRRQQATVHTWLEGESLDYSIRADSYDISSSLGQLTSRPGPHFQRTLEGPDLRLEIHPDDRRETIQGQAGTIPIRLLAREEDEAAVIEGEVGGEDYRARITPLEDGSLTVEGRLGARHLRETIQPTAEGYTIVGSLGELSIRQEVTRVQGEAV
ncbi:hypothetical protein DYH09_20730 [bacterium CPR1]|nr:hypothetical protein [bacterium CPR1]